MSTIYACFLTGDNEIMASHFLNTLAVKVAPRTGDREPQIHVELFFPDEEGKEEDLVSGQACSIHYNGTVFLTRKRFSRSQWNFRSLDTTPEQYELIKQYCQEAVGCHFNHLGYFLQPIMKIDHTWARDWFGMGRRYYCSEIVCEALKFGGVFPETMRSQIHPETLYSLLLDDTTNACVKDVKKINFNF
tara:strand:+ start:364 stop:930 length:567 start_codon:yes stop_codon:yes gene_type:complete